MQANKTDINLIVLGHPSSGKATTVGHLIYKLGHIEPSIIQQHEQEKPKYSWILNKLKDEKETEATSNLSFYKFATPKHSFTIADVLGHKNFIKNLVIGTSHADVALLNISASAGEFEAGIANDGQTRDHALLAYTLGIKQLIVCVNKMDEGTVNWSQARFDEIKGITGDYLQQIGYNPTKILFVPVSGTSGDNIFGKSAHLPWYKGPTLIDALNTSETSNSSKSLADKPLRYPVEDLFKIGGGVGPVLAGRVETGILKAGMSVCICPGNVVAEVKAIEKGSEIVATQEALPHDHTGFSVKNANSVKDVKRGNVCGDKNDPPREAISFTALITVMEDDGAILKDYAGVLDCHTAHMGCTITEIKQKVGKRNGVISGEQPEFLRVGECAVVTIVPGEPLCVEAFSDYSALGRFVIRGNHAKIIGIIKSVEKKK